MSTVAKGVVAHANLGGTVHQRPNVVVRFWRGELGLSLALNVSGLVTCVGLVVAGALNHELVADWPLVAPLIITVTAPMVMICAIACSTVSTWRAAMRRSVGETRGKLILVGCAKWWMSLVAIVGVCFLLESLGQTLRVRWPDVRYPFRAELTADGTALIVTGRLNFGSASMVRRSLDQAPRVQALILESDGGSLVEGLKIGKLVQNRELDTDVKTWCASACTFAYLAGKRRYATRTALFGFHLGNFSGGATAQENGNKTILEIYRDIGISEAFVQRVAATPQTTMWYPTHAELVANHIITDFKEVSESQFRSKRDVERIVSESVPLNALETRWPGTIELATAAAWEEHQRGASDAEVVSAIQRIGSTRSSDLLLYVSDELLEEYLQLFVDQLEVARSVSATSCSRFVAGTVDVMQVLSPDLIQREQAWLLKAVSASSTGPRQPIDRTRYTEVRNQVLLSMPSDLAAAFVADHSAYLGESRLYCDGLIAFYEEVNRLPTGLRVLMFRGMVQERE